MRRYAFDLCAWDWDWDWDWDEGNDRLFRLRRRSRWSAAAALFLEQASVDSVSHDDLSHVVMT